MHDLKLDSAGHLSSFVENSSKEELDLSSTKKFQCGLCPYSGESKSQFVHHRQFHRPRGGPYKCPHCSYNVTRRHLLNQHLPVHGVEPSNDQPHQFVSDEEEAELLESEGPETLAVPPDEAFTHLNLDPGSLTKLADSVTAGLQDIPLAWVSRGRKFYKMFKCRHCPHVNVRKANIQEHEKRHGSSGSDQNVHACSICNYRCNNAGVLSAHVKVHQNVLGIVHGLVDPSKTDEEQLRGLMEDGESVSSISSAGSSSAPQPKLDLLLGKTTSSSPSSEESGGLKFCTHCPARFLVEDQLIIHQKFHGLKLPFRCDVCSYTAREENHLLAHWKVHSSKYQERTGLLILQHGVSGKYPQPRIQALNPAQEDGQGEGEEAMDEEESAMDLSKADQQLEVLACPLCPAKFGRESHALLQYHSTLHGGDGPFRCRFCNYAVKAQDNLTKHEKLHIQQTAGTNNRRYQCPKCPSSFEKKEQFKVHSNLHGSKQKYR